MMFCTGIEDDHIEVGCGIEEDRVFDSRIEEYLREKDMSEVKYRIEPRG